MTPNMGASPSQASGSAALFSPGGQTTQGACDLQSPLSLTACKPRPSLCNTQVFKRYNIANVQLFVFRFFI